MYSDSVSSIAALEVGDHALEGGDVAASRPARGGSGRRPSRPSARTGGTRAPPAAGPRPGTSMRQPRDAKTASRDLHAPRDLGGILFQGARAPAQMLRLRSGITSSGSITSWRAEAGAGRAGAVRRVEGEGARLELVDGDAVVRTGVALAVEALLEGAARRRAGPARSPRRPRPAGAPSRSSRRGATCPGPGRLPVSGSIGRPTASRAQSSAPRRGAR